MGELKEEVGVKEFQEETEESLKVGWAIWNEGKGKLTPPQERGSSPYFGKGEVRPTSGKGKLTQPREREAHPTSGEDVTHCSVVNYYFPAVYT